MNSYLSRPLTWLVFRSLRYCSSSALRSKKSRSNINRKSSAFVDWRRVRVQGGKGGDGCVSLLRLWANPNAGPDGGDGGHGGHVIFQASTNVKHLSHLDTVITAEDGEKGYNKDCHGKNASHTILTVPVGTIFTDEGKEIKASLDKEGSMFVAARGGAGGHGNKYFTTDTNQAPLIAEIGAAGESKTYDVELRTMAHVGLIGFPNAGKSTLLRAISRARPKVASYPFTTIQPHVGVILYDDYEQVAVADIPGLIPGAHKNRGLGIAFLRHVERCQCLLFILDLSSPSPWQQLETLQFELEQYQPGLSQRPHALVANKVDLPSAQDNLDELRRRIELPVYPISAKFGFNIGNLLKFIRKIYDCNKD